MVTIIPLSQGSTQPAVYTIRTRLGGPFLWNSKFSDQTQARLGQVAGESGAIGPLCQGRSPVIRVAWVMPSSLVTKGGPTGPQNRNVGTIPSLRQTCGDHPQGHQHHRQRCIPILYYLHESEGKEGRGGGRRQEIVKYEITKISQHNSVNE